MLHWLLADESRHEGKQFWLLYGNRTEKDIYYHREFLGLAKQHRNFHYRPTLSRGDDGWQGLRGYVQDHVPRVVADRKDMHAYICGLAKMVKANRDLLKSLGWERQSILYERYD
jgi:NAD(P)H-flavin reductase